MVGDGEEAKAKVNFEVTKGAFIYMAHPLKCLIVVKFNPLVNLFTSKIMHVLHFTLFATLK